MIVLPQGPQSPHPGLSLSMNWMKRIQETMASSMMTSLCGCGQLPFPLSKNSTVDSIEYSTLLKACLLVTIVSTLPIVSFYTTLLPEGEGKSASIRLLVVELFHFVLFYSII